MYLIDQSYFIGKYDIPDINESNTGAGEFVDYLIDIDVRLFMQNLLGLDLFADFDSYVTNGVLADDAPQKWLDLVNGIDYLDPAGIMRKWNGLIYEIGDHPISLFTNLIWCRYLTDKNRIDGNGNANVNESKNAVRGNPANQFYPIWNEFVSMVGTHHSEERYNATLNQFILQHPEDYPTANFVHVDYQNRFL